MAAYDLPADFLPASARIWLEEAVLGATSPLTGDSQVRSLASHKWRMTIDYPPMRHEDAAPREAFWNRVGLSNTVRVWHPRWGVPRGTMRGSPVLAAAAAKGSTTLMVGGAFGTNLFLYPQAFDNASWVKQQATVTADAAIAPDGTLTADKLIATAATNVHQIYQTVSVVAGEKYVLSVCAQAAELSAIELQINGGTGGFGTPQPNARFNLATGTTAGVVKGSASIEDLGAGWRRCKFAVDAATATGTAAALIQLYNGGESFLGDGTSGLYLWGAQWERGSAASAYSAYATIKAGDCIGIGDQMVQVPQDATADGSGVMTVSILPMLRVAQAINTPIVWDHARVEMRVVSSIEHPYVPGYAPGITVDLREK